jgi:hypothetical protein
MRALLAAAGAPPPVDATATANTVVYAPETLRLFARDRKLRGDFAAAAELAQRAGQLAEPMRSRIPYGQTFALLDESRYAFLMSPHGPAAADLLRQAMAAWPPHGDSELRLRPLRRCMAYYQLAAGEPVSAQLTLQEARPGLTREIMTAVLGEMYCELYETFAAFPADHQPPGLADWLSRAKAMAPPARLSDLYLRSARTALRRDDGPAALGHLAALRDQLMSAPQPAAQAGSLEQMRNVLNSLMAEFPGHPALKRFAENLTPAGPATLPAQDEAPPPGG